jgi:hypothetical protein
MANLLYAKLLLFIIIDMKIYLVILLTILVSGTFSLTQRLRSHNIRTHDIDASTALSLATGDYAGLLPESLQPIARKFMGKDEKTESGGFLSGLSLSA